MGKIEEFTDIFRKANEYDELDRKFKLVCNKGIQEVLHYITKYGLNNTAITEHQALNKIAERFPMTTDQIVSVIERAQVPTKQQQFCAPHSCRSQIRIEELIEKIDKETFAYPEMEPEQDDEATEDFKDGYNQASKVIIGYLKTLPTQQDKVVVPPYVGELICWVQKNNAVPSDVISDFYSLAVDEINLPSTLELEKLSAYFTIACHRFDFEKACIIGYTVEKEQLHWIYDPIADQYLGYDRVTKKVWWLMKQNNGARAELTDAEITKVGEQYRTFVVPVAEESK